MITISLDENQPLDLDTVFIGFRSLLAAERKLREIKPDRENLAVVHHWLDVFYLAIQIRGLRFYYKDMEVDGEIERWMHLTEPDGHALIGIDPRTLPLKEHDAFIKSQQAALGRKRITFKEILTALGYKVSGNGQQIKISI